MIELKENSTRQGNDKEKNPNPQNKKLIMYTNETANGMYVYTKKENDLLL